MRFDWVLGRAGRAWLLDDLVCSVTAICLDALSLEYENAESDEDQRHQSSKSKGFLQEHESNKHDDTHLCRCDQRR